jgi:hypothetical protein
LIEVEKEGCAPPTFGSSTLLIPLLLIQATLKSNHGKFYLSGKSHRKVAASGFGIQNGARVELLWDQC